MSCVCLSKNDTQPYQYITELSFPHDVIINGSTDYLNSDTYIDKFEYKNFFYLIVDNVQDENTLKHLRIKVETEEQNLGVSFWICLSDENGNPSNDWKKTIDLYNVPNNSKIKIWYKWEVLNNLFLTKTNDYIVQVNVYSVQEQD